MNEAQHANRKVLVSYINLMNLLNHQSDSLFSAVSCAINMIDK